MPVRLSEPAITTLKRKWLVVATQQSPWDAIPRQHFGRLAVTERLLRHFASHDAFQFGEYLIRIIGETETFALIKAHVAVRCDLIVGVSNFEHYRVKVGIEPNAADALAVDGERAAVQVMHAAHSVS